jgi:hypothetical protein
MLQDPQNKVLPLSERGMTRDPFMLCLCLTLGVLILVYKSLVKRKITWNHCLEGKIRVVAAGPTNRVSHETRRGMVEDTHPLAWGATMRI